MKKLLSLTGATLVASSLLAVDAEKDIQASLARIESKLQTLESKIDKLASAPRAAAPAEKPAKKDLDDVDGIIHIHTKAGLDKVLSESGPKVIKFTTTWCTVCPMMAAEFAEAAQEFRGKAKAYAIDGDNKELRAFVREHIKEGYPTVVALPSRKAMAGNRKVDRYKMFFSEAIRDAKKAAQD